jgi:hypothetical protein
MFPSLRRRQMLAVAMAGAASVVWSASAFGSTAHVRPSDRPFVFGQAQELAYSADPGERNDVVVEAAYFGSEWIVRDPGAVIVPGAFCSAVDQHTVRCVSMPTNNPMSGLLWADVSLGDLDDRVVQIGPDPFGPFGLFADGGSGDDRLVGTQFGGELRGGPGDDYLMSPTGFARHAVLDGGGGRDEMRGGAGNETFSDGDLDGADADAAPDADVFEGGAGVDEISYSQRTSPVSVNLAKVSGANRDVIRGIESIVGGAANDRLAGDANRNVINGGGGRDKLRGNGGNDQFLNGGGRTSCGKGIDLFVHPRSTDMLRPDCETITRDRYEGHELPAYPAAVKARVAIYRFSCPRNPDFGTLEPCAATLTVREANGNRRRLASAEIRYGRWMNRRIKMPLTPLGRRRASRTNGVKATMRLGIAGDLGDSVLTWAIQLTSRQ